MIDNKENHPDERNISSVGDLFSNDNDSVALEENTDFVNHGTFISQDPIITKESRVSVKKTTELSSKKTDNQSKHKMLKPCDCKKKCLKVINEERRIDIHDQYWNMSFKEQGLWLMQRIKTMEVKRRRPRNGTGKVKHHRTNII